MRRGGNPSRNAFLNRTEIDTLVREALQNSYDQQLQSIEGANEVRPVRVVFTVIQLVDSERDSFLEAIQWGSVLQERFWDVVERGQCDADSRKQYRSVIEEIERGTPLRLLRISDYGTRGLEGADDEEGKNFKLLCLNESATQEDNSRRGGSTGVGKSVYSLFSSWSTVLFSSRISSAETSRIQRKSGISIPQDTEDPLRIFGKSELPSFGAVDGTGYQGTGFFGRLEHSSLPMYRGLSRAASVWSADAEPLARSLHLFRPSDSGTGTSVLLLGFQEPSEGDDTGESINVLATRIHQAAGRWFWPAMESSTHPLEVRVEAYDGDQEVFNERADPPEGVTGFREIYVTRGESGVPAESGIVLEEKISFQVPARRPDQESSSYPEGHPSTNAFFTLRIRLLNPGEETGEENKIAMMRGRSGFILNYRNGWKPGGGRSYQAVLMGGTACEESEAANRLEDFLWRSEPPAHDQWSYSRPELKTRYQRGGRRELINLWTEVNSRLRKIFEGEPEPVSPGSSRLARLFRIRGRTGPPPGRPRFNFNVSTSRVGDVWKFCGWVSGPSSSDGGWAFNLSLWLDGETGKGTYVPLQFVESDAASFERLTRESASQAQEISWRCTVPGNLGRLDFNGETLPVSQILGAQDFRRTVLRVDVSQFMMAERYG